MIVIGTHIGANREAQSGLQLNPLIPNLLEYGAFDMDAGWTLGDGWSIHDGICDKPGYGQSDFRIITPFLDYNKKYSVTFTIVNSTEEAPVYIGTGFGGGNLNSGPFLLNGTYTTVVWTNPNNYGWENSFYLSADWGFSGAIDNIIVTEIVQVLGMQKLTNPNFDVAKGNDGWYMFDALVISGGKANLTGEAGWGIASSGFPLIGHKYQLKYTIEDYVSGNLQVVCCGNYNQLKSAAGTYIEEIIATGNGGIYFSAGGGSPTFLIDNVSLKEIIETPAPALGEECLFNGNFTEATKYWNVESGAASIVDGALSIQLPGGNQWLAFQDKNTSPNLNIVSGRWYRISLDVTSYTSGMLTVELNQRTLLADIFANSAGSFYWDVFVSGATPLFMLYGFGNSIMTIDNISVKEIIETRELGVEQITGGDMLTPGDWYVENTACVTLTDGKTVVNGLAAWHNVLVQGLPNLIIGACYRIELDISDYIEGAVYMNVNDESWGGDPAAGGSCIAGSDGHFSYDVVNYGTGARQLRIVSNSLTTLSIDNVSIKEVLPLTNTELLTNGDFSSGTTGWTGISGDWAVVNNQLVGTAVPAYAGGPLQPGIGHAVHMYCVTYEIVAISAGDIVFDFDIGYSGAIQRSVVGKFMHYQNPYIDSNGTIQFAAGNAECTVTIANVSVKEILI